MKEEPSRAGQQVLGSQPFSALVGTRLVSLTNGRAVLEVPIRGALLQQDGYVHGGVIGYAADNTLTFVGGQEKSKTFSERYAFQAELLGCAFFDASAVARSSEAGGFHLDRDAHRALGGALPGKVVGMPGAGRVRRIAAGR